MLDACSTQVDDPWVSVNLASAVYREALGKLLENYDFSSTTFQISWESVPLVDSTPKIREEILANGGIASFPEVQKRIQEDLEISICCVDVQVDEYINKTILVLAV